MPTGRVKWFDADKGYGFVVAEDGSLAVALHANADSQAQRIRLPP